MKRSRRSVAISLFVALAVASVFVVAIAGCSGSNDGASTSALEGLDASQVKDDDLKTLNVGSDLYPPFVYTDEYGDIVGLDVEILTEALARIGYKPKYQLIDWEKKKELLASGELDCVMGSFSMTGRETNIVGPARTLRAARWSRSIPRAISTRLPILRIRSWRFSPPPSPRTFCSIA